jgi:hypothetical protein
MNELAALATALMNLLGWFMLQPTAAGIAGGFAAGWAIGTAKNKTALAELGRGVIFGVAAYGIVTLVQLVIAGGGA